MLIFILICMLIIGGISLLIFFPIRKATQDKK